MPKHFFPRRAALVNNYLRAGKSEIRKIADNLNYSIIVSLHVEGVYNIHVQVQIGLVFLLSFIDC